MNLFGFNISRQTKATNLASVNENRGWIRLFESFTGAWQTNVTVDRDAVLAYHAVFACMTLIASDISKLRLKLVEQEANTGIWSESKSSAFSPVLRKPNAYQNRIQFFENWVLSKLIKGNAYILKGRDNRGVVTKLWVLDPNRVIPMVADDGTVYYQLQNDNLAGLTQESILVPASEIIHDRFNCLFHPLVGVSPIFAAGVAATQGLRIQNNSAWFFGNKSQPGGILIAPGAIEQDTADRLKEYWEDNFTGEKAGKIAVVGDDLKYQPLALTAQDSQLIEQLRWTAEVCCSVYHVPPYKVGVGQMPQYNNIQALNTEYYSQALQRHIEDIELCLDEGLGLSEPKEGGKVLGTEFDLDNLLRMDAATQMEVLEKASGVMTIDEKRAKLDLAPVTGGASVYLQQQNFSLAALAKRDAKEDPFATGASDNPAPAAPANDNPEQERAALALLEKDFREALNA